MYTKRLKSTCRGLDAWTGRYPKISFEVGRCRGAPLLLAPTLHPHPNLDLKHLGIKNCLKGGKGVKVNRLEEINLRTPHQSIMSEWTDPRAPRIKEGGPVKSRTFTYFDLNFDIGWLSVALENI